MRAQRALVDLPESPTSAKLLASVALAAPSARPDLTELMSRRKLALITLSLTVVASALGVVIFEQGWSLAATILAAYGVITGLTIIAVLALVVFARGGPHSRPPAITRSH